MYGLLGYNNIWLRYNYLESEAAKKIYIEKITFKVVQSKFLAMHFTNSNVCFDIFMVGHLKNILMDHDPYDFGIK